MATVLDEDDARRITLLNEAGGVAPGWRVKDEVDMSLFEYTRTLAWLHALSRGGGSLAQWQTGKADAAARAHCATVWAAMRNAKIVHLGADALDAAWHAAEAWVWEHIVGVPHDAFWGDTSGTYVDAQGTVKEEWLKKSVHAVTAATPDAPWPDKLPFDTVFLAYGSGLTLTSWRTVGKLHRAGLHPDTAEITGTRIVGHVLTSAGRCYEVTYLELAMAENEGIIVPDLRPIEEGGWAATFDVSPWVVAMLVEAINLYRTFVVTHDLDDAARAHYRQRRKSMGLKTGTSIGRPGHMPPPFYRLHLHDRTIVESLDDAQRSLFPTTRTLTHRFDRRGHERCYVRRGALPLDACKREALRSNGYTVYEGTSKPISGADALRLRERSMAPKQGDEWLAIKSRWIDPTVVGDASLPYVPALRIARPRG